MLPFFHFDLLSFLGSQDGSVSINSLDISRTRGGEGKSLAFPFLEIQDSYNFDDSISNTSTIAA